MRVSAVAPFAWEGERTLTSRLQRRDGESYYDTRVETQIHSPVNWGASGGTARCCSCFHATNSERKPVEVAFT